LIEWSRRGPQAAGRRIGKAFVHQVSVKRIYEAPSPSDGRRILVDRLWPRGVRKADAHLDAWMKDVAPSTELRRWFGHRPERWDEFRRRYVEELKANPAMAELRKLAGAGHVTLLFAAKDEAHNEAVVLSERLKQ
jgi:uncharacterized protein YeaO (DUF488 family)